MKTKDFGSSLDTRYWRMKLNKAGRPSELIDKATGWNYLGRPAPLWRAVIDGKEQVATQAERRGDELLVRFGETAEAVFLVTNKVHYITLELLSVSPAVEEIALAEVNLKKMGTIASTLNAAYDDKFTFCVMALTLPVHCAPEGSRLRAVCYARYGLTGNKIALLGCPRREFEKLIQTVEKAEGLPHITLGGQWKKISPDVKRSYLFLTDLGEGNCGQAIEYAKKMNAGAILLHETWASQSMGHFPINRELFPHGQEGLKSVVDKIHRAGLKAGLHFLSLGVSFNDGYLTPVPDPRLRRDASTTLTRDIDERQAAIPCAACPPGFPEGPHPQGVYQGTGVIIQIDKELISYEACSRIPPYRFTGCVRGACGTRPAPHSRGAVIDHLLRSWSFFVFNLDTSLADEIAGRLAGIMDYCGCDMLYCDGAERLQGEGWYYNAKLLSAFYRQISPERRDHILYQASTHVHYTWHMIARTACADGYQDIKDNVNHAAETKYRGLFNNLMPLDIGWYGIGQSTVSYSDIEYVMGKSLGWDSSVGLATSIAELERNPETNAMVELVGAYDRLRRRRYFPESIRAALRRPVARHLVKLPSNRWALLEQKEAVIRAIDGVNHRWVLSSGQRRNIAELQLGVGEITAPGTGYHNRESITLVDFKEDRVESLESGKINGELPVGISRYGFSPAPAGFRYIDEAANGLAGYGQFKVKSRLGDKSGWTVFARRYPVPRDLAFMKGVGCWIYGDGLGASLTMRLEDSAGAYLDYTLSLDFQGWQYRELANFRKLVGLLENHGKIDLSDIARIEFIVTGLIPRAKTCFRLAGLKALSKMSSGVCAHPSITAGTRTITFPVSLKAGEFLVCTSSRKCTVLDGRGRRRMVRPAGGLPVIMKGHNQFCFSSRGVLMNKVTVRIS